MYFGIRILFLNLNRINNSSYFSQILSTPLIFRSFMPNIRKIRLLPIRENGVPYLPLFSPVNRMYAFLINRPEGIIYGKASRGQKLRPA